MRKTEKWEASPCRYPDLPKLTPEEFEALAVIARGKKDAKRRISDRSIAMARAVLLEGATYTEVGLDHGRPSSSVNHAVYSVLKNLHRILPALPSGVSAESTVRQD
ncbi:hypothetical protein [Paraburkholderia megapolitana]|uniref:hypothetical protein n=1 Tax=Paraburkholderia megapolitana TaxID=420953 RepID=UPI0038BA9C04